MIQTFYSLSRNNLKTILWILYTKLSYLVGFSLSDTTDLSVLSISLCYTVIVNVNSGMFCMTLNTVIIWKILQQELGSYRVITNW